MDPEQVLTAARDVVLHNWPSREVPDSLVKSGRSVTVYGGPEPDDISVCELAGDEIISRRTGVPPKHADLVYVYPWPGFDLERDLPRVASEAQELGASALWYQSGRNSDGTESANGYWLPDAEAERVTTIAESAGLSTVHNAYIADIAVQLEGR